MFARMKIGGMENIRKKEKKEEEEIRYSCLSCVWYKGEKILIIRWHHIKVNVSYLLFCFVFSIHR